MELPETLLTIGDEAFYQTSIQEIKLYDLVESIGAKAFYDCQSLQTFTMPDSVKELGEAAFYNCIALTNVALSNAIETLPVEAFYNCISLKEIAYPTALKKIDDRAFFECSNITALDLPNTLMTIDVEAFKGTSIQTLTLPDSVFQIGNRAFANIQTLTSISLPETLQNMGVGVFYGCEGIEDVVWDVALTEIPAATFSNCSNLKTVTLSETVTKIGDRAFLNCKKLEEINFPQTLTEIGNSAFSCCEKLLSVIIPRSVKTIGDNAFINCYRLTEIYNLSMLKIKLDEEDGSKLGSFARCIHETREDETHLYFDENGYVFYKAADIQLLVEYRGEATDILLPSVSGAYEIAPYAFYGADEITSIIIPKCVTAIGENAFYQCDGLQAVNYVGSSEAWSEMNIALGNAPLKNAEFTFGETVVDSETDDKDSSEDYNSTTRVQHTFMERLFSLEFGSLVRMFVIINFVVILTLGVMLFYNDKTDERRKRYKIVFFILVILQLVLILGMLMSHLGAGTALVTLINHQKFL